MAGKIFPRHFTGAALSLLALFSLAMILEASDNSTVTFGANQTITAHSTCKKVINGSATGLSVYVPTETTEEWTSFYTNPPAGIDITGCAPKVVFLTSGTTWTVPADWNASNTIEVIGGGGGGDVPAQGAFASGQGAGGGGGGYSKAVNVALTPGSTVAYAIGTGGGASVNGGDTWFCNGTSNCSAITGTAVVAGAKGGTGAAGSNRGGGGLASAGVGNVKYAGGDGGDNSGQGAGQAGTGGGGAAGPNGNGGRGGNAPPLCNSTGCKTGTGGGGANGGSAGQDQFDRTKGTSGGNNRLGAGGGAGSVTPGVAGGSGANGGGGGGGWGKTSASGGADAPSGGGVGGQDAVWSQTSDGAVAGPAGGGGGAGGYENKRTSPTHSRPGGNGGLYGGGGGGGGGGAQLPPGPAGSGAQGIIVITYGP